MQQLTRRIPPRIALISCLSDKRFRTVRIILLLLTASFIHVSAAAFGQSITITMKDAPLHSVLIAIYKQTGVSFAYEESVIQKANPVTISVKNVSLKAALDICFKDQPLTYEIDKEIVIVREKASTTNANKSVNNKTSQSINVKGKILNEKREPIIGATVTEKGTTNFTSTNDKGEFSLYNVDEKATIVVTSVGYEVQEIKLNGSTEIDAQLKLKVSELAGVSVIASTGYQEIPRERATGSFTILDNKTLNLQVGTNILNRLNGVASGVLFDTKESDGRNIIGNSSYKK